MRNISEMKGLTPYQASNIQRAAQNLCVGEWASGWIGWQGTRFSARIRDVYFGQRSLTSMRARPYAGLTFRCAEGPVDALFVKFILSMVFLG